MADSPFLTTNELIDLTGAYRSAKQIEILRRQGYSPDVDMRGRPKLLRSVVELQQRGRRAGRRDDSGLPNFDAI